MQGGDSPGFIVETQCDRNKEDRKEGAGLGRNLFTRDGQRVGWEVGLANIRGSMRQV